MEILITEVEVKDVRFPTSLLADGSDAMVRGICFNLPFDGMLYVFRISS